jgi:hypothetical protein
MAYDLPILLIKALPGGQERQGKVSGWPETNRVTNLSNRIAQHAHASESGYEEGGCQPKLPAVATSQQNQIKDMKGAF